MMLSLNVTCIQNWKIKFIFPCTCKTYKNRGTPVMCLPSCMNATEKKMAVVVSNKQQTPENKVCLGTNLQGLHGHSHFLIHRVTRRQHTGLWSVLLSELQNTQRGATGSCRFPTGIRKKNEEGEKKMMKTHFEHVGRKAVAMLISQTWWVQNNACCADKASAGYFRKNVYAHYDSSRGRRKWKVEKWRKATWKQGVTEFC